jgi:hypothetical protein
MLGVKKGQIISILNGTGDGALHWGLSVWALSNVWHSERAQRFGDWICFRPQAKGWRGTYSVAFIGKS